MNLGASKRTIRSLVGFVLLVPLGIHHQIFAQEGWQWKNPLPQGNDILGVQYLSNNCVVAVAAFGNLLRSSDGGVSWSNGYPGTPVSLNALCFVDNSTGVAVGSSGAVMRSTDGGASWIQRPPLLQAELHGISFRDMMDGVAVGDSGCILNTTDGGISWTRQTNALVVAIRGVSLRGLRGIAVGVEGTVLTTLDGGASWNQQSSPTSLALNSVCLLDDNTGLAVGESGLILRTTDCGTSWVSKASTTISELLSVRFKSATSGFVTGRQVLLKTTDGGLSWVGDGISRPAIHDIWFYGESGVLVGDQGFIQTTTDGGANWTQPNSSPYPWRLTDVVFATPTVGYATGIASSNTWSAMVRTVDAGETWSRVGPTVPTHPSPLNTIAFMDANNGIAMGDYYTSLRTVDGGVTWFEISTGVQDYIQDICFSNPSTGTMVGSGIYRTTDAANSWKRQGDFPHNYGLIQMVNHNFGVALSSVGALKTYDGGLSWNEMGFYADGTTDIYFFDETTGVVVGSTCWPGPCFGFIARTTNGGKSWLRQDSASWAGIGDVSFWGSQTGIAVGGADFTLHTSDGGATWTKGNAEVSGLQIVQMLDSNIVIATRRYDETIARSTDGGTTWSVVFSVPGSLEQYLGISFPSHDTGYVLCRTNGALLVTVNSGISWTRIPGLADHNADPMALLFTSPTTGYILGWISAFKTTDAGKVWRVVPPIYSPKSISFGDQYTGIIGSTGGNRYFTTDGGGTWVWHTVPQGFSGVTFVGVDTGLTVGAFGLMQTTDGGSVWTRQLGEGYNLKKVLMVNSRLAIAVGDGGLLIRSTDAGATWSPRNSGADEPLMDISFTDQQHGTIVGRDGAILSTSDGGDSWARLRNAPARNLRSMSFIDQNVGVIVGENGLILKTYNGGVTAAKSEPQSAIGSFSIEQNYPNPFNPRTTIEFTISREEFVDLKVYDILGREVAVLVNGVLKPGLHKRVLNASSLASGVYFYRIRSGSQVASKKMLLLK